MKIGIYNPYFDSLGGGERYMLSLAEHWSQSHDIDIFWDDDELVDKASKRFDLDLSKVHTVSNIFIRGNAIKKLLKTRKYDLIVFLSDGSVPFSLATYNILHFQVPFAKVSLPGWKASRYQAVVCNSEFTKNHLDSTIHIPSHVIYPPVDIKEMSFPKKSKIILSVGRFSSQHEAKKYTVLIKTFRKVYARPQAKGWKLVLAGGVLPSDIHYITQLRKEAEGFPVEFYPNCEYEKLQDFYNTSSLYWHAAGFGETDPTRMEHFGITTVEAMGHGCIPLVYAGGGQKEIVTESKTGHLWDSPIELFHKTMRYIVLTSPHDIMRLAAYKKSLEFNKERFGKSFDSLLQSICSK